MWKRAYMPRRLYVWLGAATVMLAAVTARADLAGPVSTLPTLEVGGGPGGDRGTAIRPEPGGEAGREPGEAPCRLGLDTPGWVEWRGAGGGYAPLGGNPWLEPVRLDIRNSGGPCDYALEIAGRDAAGTLVLDGPGHRLEGSLQVVEAGGGAFAAGPGLITGALGAGMVQSARFVLALGEGQFVPPGSYATSLDVRLMEIRPGAAPVEHDSRRIQIGARVAGVARLALGSGLGDEGRHALLRFPQARSGGVVEVPVTVHANGPYTLHARSENGGALAHGLLGAGLTLPYTVQIGGHDLRLDGTDRVILSGQGTGLEGWQDRFAIRLGPTDGALAGAYADTIHIRITTD
jgi:hypothetical protein